MPRTIEIDVLLCPVTVGIGSATASVETA